LERKDLRILIPGCGNAWEGEFLLRKGFDRVTLLDIAPQAIESVAKRFPAIPEHCLVCGDFFGHRGVYDLVLEQTFFCALNPALRSRYVQKMHELLAPNGHLVGLLFDDPLHADHPPFGGNREVYIPLFEPFFHFHTFETAHNSIAPRAGREFFINLIKKD
jgi:SAM-dependent methyltransferase